MTVTRTQVGPGGGGAIVEPITLAQVKTRLRIDGNADDADLGLMIAAARSHVESMVSLSLVLSVWNLKIDSFPTERSGRIRLPFGPVNSISAFTYVDSGGVTRTLSTYQLIDEDGSASVYPSPGGVWPETQTGKFASVSITYAAGTWSIPIDPDLIQAILMLIAHWYANRETVIVGTISKEIEAGLSFLIRQHRRHPRL